MGPPRGRPVRPRPPARRAVPAAGAHRRRPGRRPGRAGMLAPIWGYRPLLDITDEEAREQLARASVMALSYVAQSARGIGQPAVPQTRVDEAHSITERFLIRWRGEPDPAHVKALDAYWVSAA